MLGQNGYDVVYFGKNHLSKGYFNETSGEYVHDNLSRYGFHDWNGEPPLGTRGALVVHAHCKLVLEFCFDEAAASSCQQPASCKPAAAKQPCRGKAVPLGASRHCLLHNSMASHWESYLQALAALAANPP